MVYFVLHKFMHAKFEFTFRGVKTAYTCIRERNLENLTVSPYVYLHFRLVKIDYFSQSLTNLPQIYLVWSIPCTTWREEKLQSLGQESVLCKFQQRELSVSFGHVMIACDPMAINLTFSDSQQGRKCEGLLMAP